MGTGYDRIFDPGEPYEWTLGFYDIDGVHDRTYDVVALKSPAAYTLAADSPLKVTVLSPTEVRFASGDVARDIPGQTGLAPPLTAEQAGAMVLVTVADLSRIRFDYAVAGAPGRTSGRNLLIDGGTLRTALDPFSPQTGNLPPVPLPAAGWLLTMGLAALAGQARVRRAGIRPA